jgi:hypothetical protein
MEYTLESYNTTNFCIMVNHLFYHDWWVLVVVTGRSACPFLLLAPVSFTFGLL